MLKQPADDTNMSAEPTLTNTHTVSPGDLQTPVQETSGQEALDLFALLAAATSPEFQTSPEFPTLEQFFSPTLATPVNSFRSPDDFDSPLDDSPFSDYLTTPVMDAVDDVLTSPNMDYTGSLFEDFSFSPAPLAAAKETAASVSKTLAPPTNPFDNLYTMSPANPALDAINPTSLYPSPSLPLDESSLRSSDDSKPGPSSRQRKSTATGTRRNITPASLVPLDAPTQPRKYVTPSATSRKEVPAVFARKRARSQAFGDEDDEIEDRLPPNATELEQIEWKRRQNTLAARKSRKRKLMHQQELEQQVEALTKERDAWKVRTQMLQHTLKTHNLPVPEFVD